MNARAIVTTAWAKHRYRPRTISQVESYYVDSAMDTDTDQWQLALGDPTDDFVSVLRRDNEVRVELFGLNRNKVEALHSGFADEISISSADNVLQFSGRDMTAVAVDTMTVPRRVRSVRPHIFIARRARALHIGQSTKLAVVRPLKQFYTDGSETEWESWYRMYRHRRMFLWAEPDGSLRADDLNYSQKPHYFFGVPFGERKPRGKWIPVERAEWRSNKQQRVGEIFVIGHRGDRPVLAHATDATTGHWIKRPKKIIDSKTAHTPSAARAEAFEEIYETKVGAVEWRLTIHNPGFVIRQNRMALVNIPRIGLRGLFFVVGTRIAGDENGIYQEVRLREKGYAISRRIPEDPKIQDDTSESDEGQSPIGLHLAGIRWSLFFVNAAMKWRGPWPFKLFLGTLLAICEQESSFHNSNETTWEGRDWYPQPNKGKHGDDPHLYALWRERLSNSEGNPYNTFGREKGLGPMALTDLGLKRQCDEYARKHKLSLPKGGYPLDFHGDHEYYGGRWVPEANIMLGAETLRSKLKTVGAHAPDERQFWVGVQAYNGLIRGPGGVNGYTIGAYARSVRQRYKAKYEGLVAKALKDASNYGKGSGHAKGHGHGPSSGPYGALVEHTLAYAGPDQGVDFTGRGKIYALDHAVVTRVVRGGTGWSGRGAIVVYRFKRKKHRHLVNGEFVYHAEDLIPKVQVGEHVLPGQVIAEATGEGRAPGIECGWARDAHGSAYGSTRDGKPGGPFPIYGVDFKGFVLGQKHR